MISDTLRRQRFIADQFRSGDIRRIDAILQDLFQNPDPEIISGLLSGTYVDITGVLWVPPDFVVNRSKQPAVDYGFWQLLSKASADICLAVGIQKNEITTIKFRSYSEQLSHPDAVPVYYGEAITRMDKFPEAICSLPSLQKIDARDTAFSFIPDEIGKCPSLKSISLAFFNGQSIPDSISGIETLEELQIFHSAIGKWPDHLAEIPNLKFLKISSCEFKSMPAEIKLPVTARVIHLDNLKLHTVPDSVFDCRKLRELSLFGNFIETLPDKFNSLPALEKINLRENPIANEKKKFNFISHLVVSGHEQNYFRSVPGESSFHSSFTVGKIDRLMDFSAKPENPYPYRHPGLPSDDIAAAVKMISEMLTPSDSIIMNDYSVFSAGIRLLSSCGADARFTEYCLAALPIEESGYLTINELNIRHLKLLFDFLIENPEQSLCSEGSWRYALRYATIPVSSGQLNRILQTFPNLSMLKADFTFAAENSSGMELSDSLLPVNIINFRGRFLEFEGSVFSAKELVIQNCSIEECLKIKDLKGLEKIRIDKSAVSGLEISGCPQLKYVEYERKENNDFRVTNLTISHCDSLTHVRMRKIRLSGLTLNDLPSLEKLHINGRCTNARKFIINDCKNLKELEMVSCYLNELPSFISKIQDLELLRLKKCNLKSIGNELGKLKNLRTLDLSGNMLSAVPESVCNLTSLEILHLGYQGKNRPTKSLIQNLPDGLNALKHLKYVAVMMPELKLRKLATQFRSIRLSLTNIIAK